MKCYYLFLGQSILWTREKQILDYHKNGMKDLGYSFSRTKLFKVLLLEVLDILFNPKKTLERIARHIIRFMKGEQGEKYEMSL